MGANISLACALGFHGLGRCLPHHPRAASLAHIFAHGLIGCIHAGCGGGGLSGHGKTAEAEYKEGTHAKGACFVHGFASKKITVKIDSYGILSRLQEDSQWYAILRYGAKKVPPFLLSEEPPKPVFGRRDLGEVHFAYW